MAFKTKIQIDRDDDITAESCSFQAFPHAPPRGRTFSDSPSFLPMNDLLRISVSSLASQARKPRVVVL